MRLTAEVPAWMIADGEYGGVAVGVQLELGFALVPTSWSGRIGSRRLRQPDGSARVLASGVVVQHSRDVPPVLDEGFVFPILATTGEFPAVGAELEVEGRLLVEPFLWVTDGLLWPRVPDGVRLWSVVAVSCVAGDRSNTLGALPKVDDVDHDATYLITLERPRP